MTSQFQNYVPIQDLSIAGGEILEARENITESSQMIDPEVITETISESPVVTIT